MIDDKILSNDELVRRCSRGDQKACRQLYDLYAPQMLGVCMRYAHSKEVAQDLLHDGFMRVFSKMHTLKTTDNLGGWIRRIMVNVSINYLRTEMSKKADLDDLSMAQMVEAPNYSRLNVEYLLSVIQSLPPRYRMVFNLHEVEGYEYDEIASQMNISQTGVRSILCRARIMIKEKLEQDER